MMNPSFPLELLDEIVQYSCTPELLVLSQTSKRLNSIATRVLYCIVSLSDPHQAITCCRAITCQPLAALAVRRFSIDFSTRNLLHGFFRLLANALRHTTNVESLDIACALPLLYLIGTTPFAHLTQCSLPYSTDLVPFLQSHKTISDLIIQPPTRFDLLRLVSDEFPYVVLPNLDSFVGPSKVAQFVIPHSNVVHLTIFWDFDPPPEEVLPSFSLSNKSVRTLENVVMRWDQDLFSAVAKYLPGVSKLKIRNASPLDDDVEAFLDHVESLLPNLRSLVKLGITHIYSTPIGIEDLDEEHDTVTRWGQILPCLQVCTLPSGTKWSRHRPDAWLPDRGGANAEAKDQWLFQAIFSVKFPDMYRNIHDEEGQAQS